MNPVKMIKTNSNKLFVIQPNAETPTYSKVTNFKAELLCSSSKIHKLMVLDEFIIQIYNLFHNFSKQLT